LGITEEVAAKIGLRLYKIGMPWPLEPAGVHQFAVVRGAIGMPPDFASLRRSKFAHESKPIPPGGCAARANVEVAGPRP